MTCNLDISGRDARGIGGGAPFLCGDGLGTLPLTPFVVAWSSALFIPKERAGLAGIGGGCSARCFLGASTDACRAGLLGGSAGIVGRGATSTVATCGVDFVAFNGSLALSASLCPGNAFDFSTSWYRFSVSSFVRFGGNGGNVAGSKTGAFTLLLISMEGILLVCVLAVPFDRADIDEMFEMVEETDSFEAFLLSCSEGLRGGRAGDGWECFFLEGSLGGGATAGFVGCATTWPVRMMFVGGGSTPSLLGPLGSLPMPMLAILLFPKGCTTATLVD